jgi:hypothetical protein
MAVAALGARGCLLALVALIVMFLVDWWRNPVGKWPDRCFNGIAVFGALSFLVLLIGLAFTKGI